MLAFDGEEQRTAAAFYDAIGVGAAGRAFAVRVRNVKIIVQQSERAGSGSTSWMRWTTRLPIRDTVREIIVGDSAWGSAQNFGGLKHALGELEESFEFSLLAGQSALQTGAARPLGRSLSRARRAVVVLRSTTRVKATGAPGPTSTTSLEDDELHVEWRYLGAVVS